MKRSIHERLNELTFILKQPSFQYNQGLGNEVGFHIFDYDPADELLVREHIAWLKDKLSTEPFTIQVLDLWKVLLELLRERGFLEKTFLLEQEEGSERVFTAIKSMLRLATDKDLIRGYINERVQAGAVVFITGVGRVYPFVRSHTVLNNLQDVLEHNPLVLFYPGTYDQGKLRLFNQLHDDNYYRAFQIVTR